ncbi:hypothetical protein QEG98_00860 [Myxococcus sp. MxC21-1]|uniref:hypothetical protein n=1 Tax=Myxococcus sp. MxC21-1 TaxID=3041439 RepID=UPI00292D5D3C|nr:hypothetical protein [Myxococcus sp. MxC21-1]WNZ62437.1 hypothetical protein QEG98_00860 [Myxococcus sp. MxC21-1]
MTPRVREIRFHPLRTRRECPPRWDARTGALATPRPRNRAIKPAHGGERGDTVRDDALTAYLARCNELGAVEGPLGARTLNPALRPVVEALHHVLAGGEVSVQLLQRGNADIVNELNLRAERATEESSSLGTAGDILSATV